MKTTVDYTKIYNYLATKKGKIVTPSGIAHFTGVDRIYGPTMSKLVRDGVIEKCPAAGFYRVL